MSGLEMMDLWLSGLYDKPFWRDDRPGFGLGPPVGSSDIECGAFLLDSDSVLLFDSD